MHSDATHSVPGVHSWIADRLDVRLGQRRLRRAQLAGLAEALGALHAVPAGAAADAAALVARGTEASAAIAARAPELAAAAAALEATLRAAGTALAERAPTRGARKLHGALRCDRIHVDPHGGVQLGPRAEAACGDPCEDVAALAVELAARGHVDAARQLVTACAEATGDFALYRVLDAHLALAALAAAQRALASPADPGTARAAAGRLLSAPAALAPAGAPTFVIAVGGGVASGKTTLAARLASAHAAPAVSADAARPAGAATLEPGAGDAAYAEMLRRAGEVLASGRPVVLDACFATRAQRAALRALAERHRAALLFVECRADASLVRHRLEERARAQGRTVAEWLALRDRVTAAWEPPRELPREQHLPVDTGRDPALCLPRVARALGRAAAGPHRVRRGSSAGASASA